jgi:hypothetical protein
VLAPLSHSEPFEFHFGCEWHSGYGLIIVSASQKHTFAWPQKYVRARATTQKVSTLVIYSEYILYLFAWLNSMRCEDSHQPRFYFPISSRLKKVPSFLIGWELSGFLKERVVRERIMVCVGHDAFVSACPAPISHIESFELNSSCERLAQWWESGLEPWLASRNGGFPLKSARYHSNGYVGKECGYKLARSEHGLKAVAANSCGKLMRQTHRICLGCKVTTMELFTNEIGIAF